MKTIKLWWKNWKRACGGAQEWRRELKADGEIRMLVGSYAFAPLMWLIAAAVVTYFTLNSPVERDADGGDRIV